MKLFLEELWSEHIALRYKPERKTAEEAFELCKQRILKLTEKKEGDKMMEAKWPAQNLVAVRQCMKHQCGLMLRLLSLSEQIYNSPAEGLGYEGSKALRAEIEAVRGQIKVLECKLSEIAPDYEL